MTYRNKAELPETLQVILSDEAQSVYIDMYNEALASHEHAVQGELSAESAAHAVAWQAVEEQFEQPKGGGKWQRKGMSEEAPEDDSRGGLLERIKNIF